MRKYLVGVAMAGVVIVCSTGTASAQLVAAAGAANEPVGVTRHQPTVDEKLNRRIDAQFVEMPLRNAIQALQKETEIQFYLRAKRLEEASVSPDTPVTIDLKNLPARTVLELLLSELELTYLEKDGLILITTPEDAESQLDVRVYDCRDLLQMGGPTIAATKSANESVQNTKSNPIEGCGSVTPARLKSGTKQEQLQELITVNVAADTWERVGGPGAISEFNGLVVVTQTATVQRKVQELLDMLREAAGLGVPKSGKVVR